MSKCGLCKCEVSLSDAVASKAGDYVLCPACHAKINKRLESQNNKKLIQIDPEELIRLRSFGLLPPVTYVYLALRIEGIDKKRQLVDTQAFIDKYHLTVAEYISAMGRLGKKGVVEYDTPNFKARAYSGKEKMELMESQFDG